MMDILKELYFGNIQPSERSIKEGSRYQELEMETRALETAFRSELSPEGKKVYDAFIQKQGEMIEISECDAFIKGFRLGMELLHAGLLDYDTQLPQISEL